MINPSFLPGMGGVPQFEVTAPDWVLRLEDYTKFIEDTYTDLLIFYYEEAHLLVSIPLENRDYLRKSPGNFCFFLNLWGVSPQDPTVSCESIYLWKQSSHETAVYLVTLRPMGIQAYNW